VSVVIVDWLGRGGIAQTTEVWAREIDALGQRCTVVTRGGRELRGGTYDVVAPSPRASRIQAHRAIAKAAAAAVRELEPDLVIVQNYVLPPLERPLYAAARATGSRLVAVVHDHQLHSRWAGTSAGLDSLLRRCDSVIAHSSYVAEALRSRLARPVEVLPLPLPRLPTGRASLVEPGPERRLALSFGVLHRSYKSAGLVVEIARCRPDGWDVALIGAGAPHDPTVTTVDRFVEAGELRATLERAAVAILPYTYATQSASVLLAQSLGAVPITTTVGGLPEQVDDGVDGLLLPPGAPVESWVGALAALRDTAQLEEMAARGRSRAAALTREFADGVARLMAAA
jgi:glycosyltransferase involved in cell wall biosynthesis